MVLKVADELGGADLTDYETEDEVRSCDKGGHRERSIVHQPNHADHWKKGVTIYDRTITEVRTQ